MDFLQRGTEPESIQEQMIWNNRRAWAEMTATIYRPLDGSFVRGLAFMLTEEMDDCAEDYRQTDQHPIAAMNNESYEVPPAYSLPDRMNEYYDFLQKPDIHPLIKAAVAQAYLLVIRPFPEGNERLSRMMSSAVLLRSGYDFFRDISISFVIARESYRYYKCMCDIIRSEIGGDLTYFLQYYLELLVRALDVRNERQRKREQEAREREQETLRQERELARKPLTPTVQPCEEDNIDWDVPDDADGTPLPKPPAPVDDEPADAEDVDTADPESPFVNSYSRVQQPLPLMEPDRFLQAISKLKHSRYPGIRDMPDKVSQMIRAGLLQFSVSQWSEITGTDKKNADYECRYMYEKGWMTRTKEDKCLIYSLRIRTDGVDFENGLISLPGLSENPEGMAGENEAGQLVEEDSSPHESLQTRLIQLEQSRSPLVQSIVTTIHDLQDQGINAFTCNESAGQRIHLPCEQFYGAGHTDRRKENGAGLCLCICNQSAEKPRVFYPRGYGNQPPYFEFAFGNADSNGRSQRLIHVSLRAALVGPSLRPSRRRFSLPATGAILGNRGKLMARLLPPAGELGSSSVAVPAVAVICLHCFQRCGRRSLICKQHYIAVFSHNPSYGALFVCDPYTIFRVNCRLCVCHNGSFLASFYCWK